VTAGPYVAFTVPGGGGPRGERNGAYLHGLRTAEARTSAGAISKLLRQVKRSLNAVAEN
jgi:hypothetical protein